MTKYQPLSHFVSLSDPLAINCIRRLGQDRRLFISSSFSQYNVRGDSSLSPVMPWEIEIENSYATVDGKTVFTYQLYYCEQPDDGNIYPFHTRIPIKLDDILVKDLPAQQTPSSTDESTLPNIPQQHSWGSPVDNPDTVAVTSTAHAGAIHTQPPQSTEKRITSYDEMEKFLTQVQIRRKGENFYIFNGKYYRSLIESDLPSIVLAQEREVIREIGTPGFLRNVVSFIGVEPAIRLNEDDSSSGQIAFNNGVLDIQSGQWSNHSPNYRIFYGIDANYYNTPNIPECPVFESFLHTICRDDYYLKCRIWEMIGYLISPDTAGKVLFLLQGVSNSGKTILSSFIYKLFSPDSVYSMDVHDFGDQFSLAGLTDVMLCLSADLDSSPLDARTVSRLKQFTGNDYMSTDIKFKDRKIFKPTAKLVMATNHPFLTKAKDEAFEQRIITIPFRYAVSRECWDHNLLNRLLNERDSIVSRAISAYFNLVRNNYCFSGNYPPNACISGTPAPMDARSTVYAFVQQHVTQAPDKRVFAKEAYTFFCQFISGVQETQFYSIFKDALQELMQISGTRKRMSGNENPQSCYIGITLI